MNRTHTYTAKLSKATHRNLVDFLNQLRMLYNFALQERKERYKRTKKGVSKYNQFDSLTQVRANDEWFAQYPVLAQRSVLTTLDEAMQHFFRRVENGEKPGFPRFKGRGRGIRSFEINNPTIQTHGKRKVLLVKGVGKFRFKADWFDTTKKVLKEEGKKTKIIKAYLEGKEVGVLKQARVVKTPRRVNVQLICDLPDTQAVDTRPPIGIDVGVKSRMTTSNGHQIKKRVLDRSELKRLQRKVSKAVKGSNNRKKKVKLLAKEHQRVREREKGYLHELTADIIKRHSARIVVEDIDIKNLTASGKGKRKTALNRSILEQNWGQAIAMLTYKAESAGGYVKKVDPKNTSQVCSACNRKAEKKLELGDRVFKCEVCGYTEDRDVNAATNVLHVGLIGKLGGGPDVWGKEDLESAHETLPHRTVDNVFNY